MNVSEIEVLERPFAAIGARVSAPAGPWLGAPTVDVTDARGFVLDFAGRGALAEAQVVHVAPADRHLLLLVRSEGEKRSSSAVTTSVTGSSPRSRRARAA